MKNGLPTQCQCEKAGNCQLLRRIDDPWEGRPMSNIRHEECQSKPHYFELFLSESVAGGNTKPRTIVKVFGPSKGLGDTISKMLSRLGIEKKEGCKCSQRQDTLNYLFPYDFRIWGFPVRFFVYLKSKLTKNTKPVE